MADKLDFATLSIHADDKGSRTSDVSAPIHVSTTFKYSNNPDELRTVNELEELPSDPIYSRLNQPNVSRIETVLSEILDGHAVAYSSGLSAFHAAMVHYNPKTVFVGEAYHGCRAILKILARNYNVKVHSLEDLDENPNLPQKGDVVHLETPLNPYGIALDIKKYVDIAHNKGAYLTLDSTFAPPPLQYPFKFGVDLVLHSATKYFGGHSDLLAGILVTKDPKVAASLIDDRVYLGTIPASLESWLLLRSLRSYELRVRRQVANAIKVVKYLDENKAKFPALTKIYHASLQTESFVKAQLPLGGGPVFSFEVKDDQIARALPSKLKYFHHATSLGGVESLIEWRAMSDPYINRTLLRVSIGIENADDLIEDLTQALEQFS